jgi:hypothetical protein
LTSGNCNYLGTSGLCFKKLLYPRDSDELLGVFINGESIINTNNSNEYLKKFEIGSGHAYLDQE